MCGGLSILEIFLSFSLVPLIFLTVVGSLLFSEELTSELCVSTRQSTSKSQSHSESRLYHISYKLYHIHFSRILVLFPSFFCSICIHAKRTLPRPIMLSAGREHLNHLVDRDMSVCVLCSKSFCVLKKENLYKMLGKS